MARVKSGMTTKHRHKKVLKMAKGYYGSKHLLYKTAHEQVMKSLVYAYRDRKANKRNFRKLWITRINAACRMRDISYSRFMNGLKKANVEMNRKVLSEVAIFEPETFDKLVSVAKAGLSNEAVQTTAVEVEENQNDLSKMTIAELKEAAKAKGLTGYSKLKKAELIEALQA